MNFAQVRELDREFVVHTYDRYPVLLVSGNGVHLYDDQGNQYLDFLSGIGVNALGYAHPAFNAALAKQMQSGTLHTSNLFHNPYQAKLAEKLCTISGMSKAFIANSGTEAWEGALKFARLHARAKSAKDGKPRPRILAMENSFHGRSFGSLSTTGQAKYRDPFAPLVPDIEFVGFNEVADLTRKVDGSVAAICFETIQGEGGIIPVTPEFFLAARKLADSVGALVIADEVQCGVARTGKWFAFQHYGLQPDIVTLGKPIAGGIPLSAVLMTDAVAECVKPGMHGTTFGGGPFACNAALTALEIIEGEGLLTNAAELGGYIGGRLRGMMSRLDCIREVRAVGLMIGVELVSAEIAKGSFEAMLARKIIINRTHEKVLRFLPPFIITQKHADEMLSALEEVLIEQADMAASRTGAGDKHIGQ